MSPHSFIASTLLGARAARLYRAFRESLKCPGDVAECGVFAGATSRELTRYLDTAGSEKTVHLFDCFSGLPPIITPEERRMAETRLLAVGRFHCPVQAVREHLQPFTRYIIHEGLFSDTLPVFVSPLCFIHADADLYQSTVEIIQFADRCLVPGGRIVFDDYGSRRFPGVRLAVSRCLSRRVYELVEATATIQCFARKRAAARLPLRSR